MMAEKIKVLNLTESGVNINLTAFNGKVIPVSPKGFCFLSADELAYVRNTSIAFERGTLKVADAAQVPEDIDIPQSPNALTDADIVALLKKPQKQLGIALEEIDNAEVVRKILEAAKEQDKSVKVIETIEARLNELI